MWHGWAAPAAPGLSMPYNPHDVGRAYSRVGGSAAGTCYAHVFSHDASKEMYLVDDTGKPVLTPGTLGLPNGLGGRD
ncbi:hypothetical protein WJX81_004101 [Elliptochloris bilobata]|uniref:Uncharacterized protein n=1 Tax=Elliptochloris bilobata TaxID=381761 RepID=A0AAW1R3J7_9CHLO